MLLALHISDGLLDRPVVLLVLWLLAAASLAVAVRRLRSRAGDKLVPLVGVTSAGIFAGQMVNFPLLGLPASGHLLGGVLAAVLLGPWGAILAMAAVLAVQCLLFADGGLVAYAANLLNMGLLGGGVGYCVFRPLRDAIGGPRGTVIAAMVASWLVVPLAGLACAAELAACGKGDFSRLAVLMLGYHAVIGLVEAVITGLAVRWLLVVRPDMLYDAEVPARPWTARLAAAGLGLSLLVAVVLAPWASPLEDAFEHVVEREIGPVAAAAFPAPFPDYDLTAAPEIERGGAGQQTGAGQGGGPWGLARLATSLLGGLGTVTTFAVAVILAGSLRVAAHAR